MSNAARTITATLRWRQKPTSWSIIEEDSALDHDLLAVLDARAERHGRAFLQLRLDGAPLEGPGRGRDKHQSSVVVHEKRRRGQNHAGLFRSDQCDRRE